ncbi:hypothetical protein [Kingella potus]|uniref:hypothetical protein n=1 Tax=Kingella potus TaxID=265175 RepID=UPI001FD2CD24|nr:hypothetical protein [Kingella potus]UOP01665.1 hypothetical protein LVJ84_05845 [Kingella potus]
MCGTATHAALGVSGGLCTRIVKRVRRYGETPYGANRTRVRRLVGTFCPSCKRRCFYLLRYKTQRPSEKQILFFRRPVGAKAVGLLIGCPNCAPAERMRFQTACSCQSVFSRSLWSKPHFGRHSSRCHSTKAR